MGKLVNQPISTLFQGVSRQPDTVRLPGQIEEGDNVVLSVVTGGFEKRPGTKHITTFTDVGSDEAVGVFGYERDTDEQYVILLKNAEILVYDLDGNKKTVSVADNTRTLFDEVDASSTGATDGFHIAYPSTETEIELTISGIEDSVEVDIEGSTTGAFAGEETVLHSFTADGSSTVTIKPYIRLNVTTAGTATLKLTGKFADLTYLLVDDPTTEFDVLTIEDYSLICNKTVTVKLTGAGTDTVYGPIRSYSDRPQSGVSVPTYLDGYDTGGTAGKWDTTDKGVANGSIWKVDSSDADRFGYYFIQLDNTTDPWAWEEAADPTLDNEFVADTMPHQLIRQADGTFLFRVGEWNERGCGDPTVVPNPPFVDGTINAMAFFSDRLWFLSADSEYPSQVSDYFNFWPDKATDVLDSDPFPRAAPGDQVNILKQAVPFKRSLFATSALAQFETTSSGNLLTPRTANISGATEIRAETRCRPVKIGNELYLASYIGASAVIVEYFYEETAISNDTGDITKHVLGYIPAPVVSMSAETSSGTLLVLSNSERNSLYVYTTYWKDEDSSRTKVQSAWCRWKFGDDTDDAYIHGTIVLQGILYLVIRRGDDTFFEKLAFDNEFQDGADDAYLITPAVGDPWPVRLDRRDLLTGVYDENTELTTWTTNYPHNDEVQLVTTDDFTVSGRRLKVSYPTDTTITASGDFSSGEVIAGIPYLMYTQLSKQFVRESVTTGSGRSITNGRLQLKTMTFDYSNSGYFEVVVTPAQRTAKTWKFVGRTLGAASNIIGNLALSPSGSFTVRPNSKASTVKIAIQSDEYVPVTITSINWIGFFNEITRQE